MKTQKIFFGNVNCHWRRLDLDEKKTKFSLFFKKVEKRTRNFIFTLLTHFLKSSKCWFLVRFSKISGIRGLWNRGLNRPLNPSKSGGVLFFFQIMLEELQGWEGWFSIYKLYTDFFGSNYAQIFQTHRDLNLFRVRMLKLLERLHPFRKPVDNRSKSLNLLRFDFVIWESMKLEYLSCQDVLLILCVVIIMPNWFLLRPFDNFGGWAIFDCFW